MGSHLCRRLVRDGFNVTILSRPSSNTRALGDLAFTNKIGDITDAKSVREAVEGKDFVFHAAAHGAYWGRDRAIQNEINIHGTRNVAEASRFAGVKKLVHVSSMSAIGIPENAEAPADENFHFNLEGSPLNYHISKKRGEEMVLESASKGLEAVIVNPCSIWGQHGRQYRLEEFVQKVRQTRVVPYFTGGTCVVHVEDVVDGIMAAAIRGKTGERYILGGDNFTFREIAESAARQLELRRTFVPLPNAMTWLAASILESAALLTHRRPRISFVTHYCAGRFHYYDSSKAKTELDYSPRKFEPILDECISFITSREAGATPTDGAALNVK